MSGEISCQSEVVKGTTFSFNIFVGKAQVNVLERQKPKTAILNVLVVDDNEISLSVLSGLLGFVELSVLALECEKQSSLLSGKSINIEPIASLLKLMELIRLLLESVFKSESESESSLGSELKLEPIDSGMMNELRHA